MNEGQGNSESGGFTPLYTDRGGVDSSLKRLPLEPTPPAVRDIIRDKIVHPNFFDNRETVDDPTRSGFYRPSEGHSSPPRANTHSQIIAPPQTAQFENQEEIDTIQNIIMVNQEAAAVGPVPKAAYVPALLASPQGNLDSANSNIIDSTTKTAKEAVAKAAAAALLETQASDEEESSEEEEDESREGEDDEDDEGQALTTDGDCDVKDQDFSYAMEPHQQTPAPQPNSNAVLSNLVDISPDGMSTTLLSPGMFDPDAFVFSDEVAAMSPQARHHNSMQQVLQSSCSPCPPIKDEQREQGANAISNEPSQTTDPTHQVAGGGDDGETISFQHNAADEKTTNDRNLLQEGDYSKGNETEEATSNDLTNQISLERTRETNEIQGEASQSLADATEEREGPCSTAKGLDTQKLEEDQSFVAITSPHVATTADIDKQSTNQVNSNSDGANDQLDQSEVLRDTMQEADAQSNQDENEGVNESSKSHLSQHTATTQEAIITKPKKLKTAPIDSARLMLPVPGGKQVTGKKLRRSPRGKPVDKENNLPGRSNRHRSLPTRKKKGEEQTAEPQLESSNVCSVATNEHMGAGLASPHETSTSTDPDDKNIAILDHEKESHQTSGKRLKKYTTTTNLQLGKGRLKACTESSTKQSNNAKSKPGDKTAENATPKPVKRNRGRPRKERPIQHQEDKPEHKKLVKRKRKRAPKKSSSHQIDVEKGAQQNHDTKGKNDKKRVKPAAAMTTSANDSIDPAPHAGHKKAPTENIEKKEEENRDKQQSTDASSTLVSLVNTTSPKNVLLERNKIEVKGDMTLTLSDQGPDNRDNPDLQAPPRHHKSMEQSRGTTAEIEQNVVMVKNTPLLKGASITSPTDSEAAENKALEAANRLLQKSPENCPVIPNSGKCRTADKEVVDSPPTTIPRVAEEDNHNSHDNLGLDRTVNPLLGYRLGMGPCQLDPVDNEPPHVSAILQLSEICFPQPDTFPLSYYYRLLGYDVPVSSIDNSAKGFLRDDTVDIVPPEGNAVSLWEEQRRGSKPESDEFWDPLFKIFLKDAWDSDYCHPFSPEDVKMTMDRCADKAKECHLLGISNWVVQPMDADNEQTWTFQAYNKLKPGRVYGLGFCFEHYTVVDDDGTFDTQVIEDSPVVVSVHFANLERDLLFENEGGSPNNPVLFLLFGLIVEVARSCKARFCLLELYPSLARVLQNYFWIARVENGGRPQGFSKKTGREKWVCDLSRSSLDYAIRYGASILKGTIAQRLLVALPTPDESLGISERRKSNRLAATKVDTGWTLERRKSNRLATKVDQDECNVKCQPFTSAAGEARRSFVGLRVKKGFQSSSTTSLDITFINRQGQQGPSYPSTKNLNSGYEWEVLNSFPLRKSNKCVQSSPFNEVLSQLKKKQEELESLETKILKPKADQLMELAKKERREYDHPDNVAHRKRNLEIEDEYEKRFSSRDIGRTWKQLLDDMEKACVICDDGEVTPHNWIVICDGCEAPVHQKCYSISEVPKGKYFCQPCQLKRENVLLEDPVCELCPVSDGAFLQVESFNRAKPKWVHVVCAEWQNLEKVGPATYADPQDIIENFAVRDIHCCLCQGNRGAFSRCHHKNCENFMHVTCARFSDICDVINGEAGTEFEKNTIFCPHHSTRQDADIDDTPSFMESPIQELVQMAEGLPPTPSPFLKQTGPEQRQSLKDHNYEQDFLCRLANSSSGTRCDCCGGWYGDELIVCQRCKARVCAICTESSETERFQKGAYVCGGCLHQQTQGAPDGSPQCNVCYQKGGWLRRAVATPMPKKAKWFSNNPNVLAETLFKEQLWCHTICAKAHIDAKRQDTNSGRVDLSNAILADGHNFLKPKRPCSLCGNKGGLKKVCNRKGCRSGFDNRIAHHFHATCARQAGFTVSPPKIGDKTFNVLCLAHSDTENNLRARIEDLLEIEASRIEKRGSWGDVPMTYAEAARTLNICIQIMCIFGWAWRWEEWWVKTNFNWEPFIPFMREGQTEDDFTDEEKRIVVSTRASRQADAESCSLATFGAALRNRNYDTRNGFDNKSLHSALRAILNTKSLVGPLKDFEIDFLSEWLGRAYRSKSPHLYFGIDKVEIGDAKFCYQKDRHPKFELGGRPLPGKDSSDSVIDDEHPHVDTGNMSPYGIEARLNVATDDNVSPCRIGRVNPSLGDAESKETFPAIGSAEGANTDFATPGNPAFHEHDAQVQSSSKKKTTFVEREQVSVLAASPGMSCHGGKASTDHNEDFGGERHKLTMATKCRVDTVPHSSLKGSPVNDSEAQVKAHNIPTQTIPSSSSQMKESHVESHAPTVASGSDSATETEPSVLFGGAFTHACSELEHKKKDKERNLKLAEGCGNSRQITSKKIVLLEEKEKAAGCLKGKEGHLTSTKRAREEVASSQEIPGIDLHEPPTQLSKCDGHNSGGPMPEKMPVHKSEKNTNDANLLSCNTGSDNSLKASKKRRHNEISKDLGKEETRNMRSDPSEEHPSSEEESCGANEDASDDDEESNQTVKTVRTRKNDLEDATYKEALKKMKLKSPPLKAKHMNRPSHTTAETAKITTSPTRPVLHRLSNVTSPMSYKSSAMRTHKSGMSRRLRPTRPSVSFGKPTMMGPPKVGIKGSSVNEDDIDDGGTCFADDATFSGRSLHVRQDDISVLTEFTHFPKHEPDEDVKSRHSCGSDEGTISEAIKKARNEGFAVGDDTELPPNFRDDICCRHQPVYLGSAHGGECVMCSKEIPGTKTLFGCSECFLLAFEYCYEVKIDRNNIPDFFKHKAVFLCADRACYERWHSKDERR